MYITDVDRSAPVLFNNVTGEQWLDLDNGIGNDGIFDIVVVTRQAGAVALIEAGESPTQSYGGSFQEEGFSLGTITNGESFFVDATNDHGVFTITTVINDIEQTFTMQGEESADSYLKYGSYLQARDPFTSERVLTSEDKANLTIQEKEARFREFYASRGIVEGSVSFDNVTYQRILDEGVENRPPPANATLENGGFETGLDSWEQVEPAFGSGVSASGEGAAKAQSGGSITQSVSVIPGVDYILNAMIRVEVKGDETLEDLAGSSYILLGDQTITIPTPDEANRYELSTVEFNSGSNDAVAIRFVGGDLRVDDVALVTTDSATAERAL